MALRPLDPAPTIPLSSGWELVGTEAGRTGMGLRATVELFNGDARGYQTLILGDTTAQGRLSVAFATVSGLLPEVFDQAIPQLANAIEGILRQSSPQPASHVPVVPYQETHKGLVLEKNSQNGPVPVPLTNFTARIMADIVEDDGAETRHVFEIEATRDGRPYKFQVAATHYAGMGWVTEHLGAGALVYAGMGLKDHARAAIQILSGDPPTRHVYRHTGWRQRGSEWLYLHAGGAVGAQGHIPDVEVGLDSTLGRYELLLPSSQTKEVQAIRASLNMLETAPDSITLPVYSAIWRAPLGHVDHSIHLAGQTGAGKTAIAALAQQHYGLTMDARGLPGSWSSTGNALEGMAFATKDALLAIDDFCPSGAQADMQRYHRDADRVFRAQGNTSGRQRMRPDGTLRPVKPPRGLILSTGEDIPYGHSLRARMLVLEVPADTLGTNKAAFTACQQDANTGLYAQAMGGYLRWLAPQIETVRQAMPQDANTLRARAVQGIHLRTSDIQVQLMLGLQTFLAYALDVGAISDSEHPELWQRGWDALADAANAQDQHQTDEDVVQRFLTALAGAITAGDAYVADAKTPGEPCDWPQWGWGKDVSESTDDQGRHRTTVAWRAHGRCVGWLDGDRLYLDPEAAYSVAERFAAGQKRPLATSSQTLWKRMKEHSLLIPDPQRQRNKVQRMIGTERQYVINVAAKLIYD